MPPIVINVLLFIRQNRPKTTLKAMTVRQILSVTLKLLTAIDLTDRSLLVPMMHDTVTVGKDQRKKLRNRGKIHGMGTVSWPLIRLSANIFPSFCNLLMLYF